MLPLEQEAQIELARKVMKDNEDQIRDMVKSRGHNQRLLIQFDGLGFFGKTENSASVIYMKIKEDDGQMIELLKDVIHLLVHSMLEAGVLEKHEMSHVSFNNKSKRYELKQQHLTLMNSAYAARQLKSRFFDASPIVDNHFENLKFEPIVAETIEISTRFHFDDETGFYVSQKTIDI